MRVLVKPSTISRLLLAAVLWGVTSVATAAEVSFLRDVAPILLQRCSGCHGSSKVEGGYRVHAFEFLMRAGDSEETAVEPGKPHESELFRRITAVDESSRMPQLDDPLTAEEVDVFRRWIADGAKFDGRDPKTPFKSQLPPRTHPAPPEVYSIPVPVQAIAFSPDGREIACSGHQEVTIWSVDAGRLIRRIKHLPQQIHAVTWLREGRSLVVSGGTPGEYGEVTVVGADAPPRVLGTFDDLALSAAVSHDNSLVVATSADRNVRCYRISDGALRWESRLHSDWVTCSAFSSDDRFIATGSRDLTIKALDAATGSLSTTYNGHQQQLGPEKGRFQIHAIASAGEGLGMFSGGEGRSIRMWDLEKAREENGSAADMEIRFYKAGHTKLIRHESKSPILGLAASGTNVFAATGDGNVLQFETGTQKLVRSYVGLGDQALAVTVHAPTGRMAAAAFDGGVRVWNVATGELVTSFVAAPGIAAVAQAGPQKDLLEGKKVIEWGWDEPDTAFLRKNIETMEQFPFDGLIFHAKTDKGANLAWEVWGDNKFAEADFKQAVDDLKATKFNQFTDRFLRVNVTPGKVDWFDDDGMSTVLNNFAMAARVAKEGGCKGFMFDTEQYDGAVTLFDYRKQNDKRTFADCQAKVRQRGREWIQAVNREFPNITILLTFGYEMSFRHAEKPGDRSTAPYGLLADFLDGMLEAAAKETVLVDAWEFSYPYKERKQFQDAYETITQKALKQTALRENYKRHVKAGFGLWMDHRRKEWDLADFSKNHFSPAEFETAVRSALETSDEYVWIYTERPRWWTNEMLPPAYVEALTNARKAKTE